MPSIPNIFMKNKLKDFALKLKSTFIVWYDKPYKDFWGLYNQHSSIYIKQRYIDKFLNDISRIKIRKYLWVIRQRFDYNSFVKYDVLYYQKFLNDHNDTWYKSKLENSLISDLLQGDSVEQKQAVLNEEDELLLNAGAGSGKTKTLLKKIKYDIKLKRIEQDRILFIAFNKSVVKEIQSRLNSENINVNTTTLHALGRKIVASKTLGPISTVETNEQKAFYREYFNTFLKGSSRLEFYHFINITKNSLDINGQLNITLNHKYTTKRGESVKSLAEKEIADYLSIHSINYLYEPSLTGLNSKPDFYIQDYNIIIENWGLTKENQVPAWFDFTTKKYLEDKAIKTSSYSMLGYKLVDTYSYEYIEKSLLPNLQKNLLKYIPENKFIKINEKEIEKIVFASVTSDEEESMKELIVKGLEFLLQNNFDLTYLDSMRKYVYPSFLLYLDYVSKIFTEFQIWKADKNKITFDEMIFNALKVLNTDQSSVFQKYDLILVDEFQDMSKSRLELIKKVYNYQINCKLMCVGDDWQSIYAFAGTNMHLFLDFKQQFTFGTIRNLTYNFRSSDLIVETGNHIISHNQNKSNKTIKAFNKKFDSSITLYLQDKFDREASIKKAVNIVKAILHRGIDINKILVIARNNKSIKLFNEFCGEGYEINTLTIHKSKGLEAEHVILLDVVENIFPSLTEDHFFLRLLKNKDPKHSLIEEERRLFYVAITRASKYLYIFGAKDKPSIFLKEIEKYVTKTVKI